MPLRQPKIIEGLIIIYALVAVTFRNLECFLECKTAQGLLRHKPGCELKRGAWLLLKLGFVV